MGFSFIYGKVVFVYCTFVDWRKLEYKLLGNFFEIGVATWNMLTRGGFGVWRDLEWSMKGR